MDTLRAARPWGPGAPLGTLAVRLDAASGEVEAAVLEVVGAVQRRAEEEGRKPPPGLRLAVVRALPDLAGALEEGAGLAAWERVARYLATRGPWGPDLAAWTRKDGPDLTVDLTLERFTCALWGELERDAVAPPRATFRGFGEPVARVALALRGNPRPGRTWTEAGHRWTELAPGSELDRCGVGPMRMDTAYLPEEVAARLLAGDYGDLRGASVLPLLDLLFGRLAAAFAVEPYDGKRVPKLALPTGNALAATLGRPANGRTGAEADATLWALSGLALTDPRGTIQRLILAPERRKHGGGRPRTWLVTPGELLLPTLPADMAELARRGKLPTTARPWRRVLPWPDTLAPSTWPPSSRHWTDAEYLALALALAWTEAAGLDHGKRWRDRPGVRLNGEGWRQLVDRAHADPLAGYRARALDAWTAAGWTSLDGDLVAPGPALPRLSLAMTGAAGLALARTLHRHAGSRG